MYTEPYQHDEDLTGPCSERDAVAFYNGLLVYLGVLILIGGLAGWKATELGVAALRWMVGLFS